MGRCGGLVDLSASANGTGTFLATKVMGLVAGVVADQAEAGQAAPLGQAQQRDHAVRDQLPGK
ncbi:hypothetical protein [Streptomyces sp. NPDC093099]|uniref:hypothetical protein n=1 Tax=Streptomyces sp. NPDC093099 TaxID=3366028 RepID=UPI00380CFDB1